MIIDPVVASTDTSSETFAPSSRRRNSSRPSVLSAEDQQSGGRVLDVVDVRPRTDGERVRSTPLVQVVRPWR